MRKTLPVFCAVLATVYQAAEAEKPKAPATSSRVTHECPHIGDRAIEIDGKIDESAWQLAKPMTSFGIVRTDKTAAYKTVARLVWDDKHLYVAFECTNDGIRATVKERDGRVWEGEAAELFFCPRGADAFYYEFEFNPLNAIYDSRVESWKYEDQVKNWEKWAKGFNARIKSAVQVQRGPAGKVAGWTVEASIPFQDLDVIDGKAPAVGDVWLFNVFRVAVKADNSQELSHWQPVKPEFHRPHQFPQLTFTGKR